MIEVDISDLKINIASLGKLIDEYEIIKLNLFNQLKNASINWQDGNSLVFEDEIFEDKNETDMILQSLRSKREVYLYIYNKYVDIGNKISCNLNNEGTLTRAIDDCYNLANEIINDFNYVDTSFSYTERSSILLQKNKIIEVRNDISDMRTAANKMYAKIKDYEKEINVKIKELEEIKIENFDYDLV